MKKNVLLLLALSVLTISCGGKNGKNGEVNEEIAADCGCGELFQGKLHGTLFTGNCADKDQNDTIILRKGFKNGYMISEMTKEKVHGKYIVTKDLTYDDGKDNNGFWLSLKEDNGYTYTSYYNEYKDGKSMNNYIVYLSSSSADYISIKASWDTKNGKDLYELLGDTMPEESRPNCMPDAESENYSIDEHGWKLEKLDRPVFDKVVSDLQKEFPKFYYFK